MGLSCFIDVISALCTGLTLLAMLCQGVACVAPGDKGLPRHGIRHALNFEGVSMLAHLLPMGIVKPIFDVQKSWMLHADEQFKAVGELVSELSALQLQALARLSGLDNESDLVPAVKWDERFEDPAWVENPAFNIIKSYYLLYTHWLEDRIYETPDLPEETKRKAAFWVRCMLDAMSPSNNFLMNPVAQERFIETGGNSLYKGFKLMWEDLHHADVSLVDGSEFKVGENLATTPGAVVYRNELLELIQYTATTSQVYAQPIVIVTPWINKYYVVDLTEEKSLVRFLVGQGFTVFTTSWKNPGVDMKNTTLDDYLLNGILQAVQAAKTICDVDQINLVGYCLGGTMVAAAMAWLNRAPAKSKGKKSSKGGDKEAADIIPVNNTTFFTSLVDFSNPGDIEVFVDEDSIKDVEKLMAMTGYLDGKYMATSFRLIRSNSLIWHYYVHNYLLGETPPPFDILYWNMDTTRMPEAMHSFYLRELYLNNRMIKKDDLILGDRPIDLSRIEQPLYVVGAEQDAIVPWRESFKICSATSSNVRYVLATSGHIMGVINPPVDPPKRRYWVADATGQTDPDKWQRETQKIPGSWWQDWISWLQPQSGERREARQLGGKTHRALCDAPGTYVLE